ncbi:MAG: xylulokinase [Actinomycetota bacterium]|jgi:xylulokinase
MKLVAGVDSSTQSCKVVIRELESGQVIRSGHAKHPEGTEADPQAWWAALESALSMAGGLDDVAAISIAGQQHGMVALDAEGRVIRPALLWNDTRSAKAALDLIEEFGVESFVTRTGSMPVASFTITKLRWLRDQEPENAAKVAAVALPHDWLTWRLRGFGPAGESALGPDLEELVTDRSDASGTGYFNPETNRYDDLLVIAALGHLPILPRILVPGESAGPVVSGESRALVACGAGDNAGAALGLGARDGDIMVSLGTSGTIFAVTSTRPQDRTGTIAGFADASGLYLPIAVTLNAARILSTIADLLGVDFDELASLALMAPAGAEGLVLVPYFEGERTPNLPNAKASIHGMSIASSTRENLARAAIEGMLCGLNAGLLALEALGIQGKRILLIGGAAQNIAVQEIARTIFSLPIETPVPGEYVAEGAAVQAAWTVTKERPDWKVEIAASHAPEAHPEIMATYLGQASKY